MKTKIVIAILVCGVITLSFTTRTINNSSKATNKTVTESQASHSEPAGGLAIEDKF